MQMRIRRLQPSFLLSSFETKAWKALRTTSESTSMGSAAWKRTTGCSPRWLRVSGPQQCRKDSVSFCRCKSRRLGPYQAFLYYRDPLESLEYLLQDAVEQTSAGRSQELGAGWQAVAVLRQILGILGSGPPYKGGRRILLSKPEQKHRRCRKQQEALKGFQGKPRLATSRYVAYTRLCYTIRCYAILSYML